MEIHYPALRLYLPSGNHVFSGFCYIEHTIFIDYIRLISFKSYLTGGVNNKIILSLTYDLHRWRT